MNNFKKLLNIMPFNDLVEKLTIADLKLKNIILSNKEKSYLLAIAIFLLEEFDFTKVDNLYLEFGYYIILKYSIVFNDFKPLYDFAVNFGFYPIAIEILNNNLIKFDSLINISLEENIKRNFKNDFFIETYKQKELKEFMFKNNYNVISLIAPTSFGKSQWIIEKIKKELQKYEKIAIIVPTKSLLAQTYRLIKNSNFSRKIITHDEMYDSSDKEFIAILTQERALRLLDKNIFFNCLYIDEAHKIFEDDQRAIFLHRLIKMNWKLNNNHKVIYLSPLIINSNNLKLNKKEEIVEKRIDFSMKEPEYYGYELNSTIIKYNRFFDKFYEIKVKYNDFIEYILLTKKSKNFIFINTPKKIEMFAKELFIRINEKINEEAINELIFILTKYIHKDFYMNEFLKKGIIYIHGKLPDNIKEYLEYKFSTLKSISYLIANTVILEGINLPIESIYILSTLGLDYKDLTNLIGRANRLNYIFDNKNNLYRLLPQIHFVNSQEYNNGYNMKTKISYFKKKNGKDEILNPVLYRFDKTKVKNEKKRLEVENIIENEKFIFNFQFDELTDFKRRMIKLGLNKIFKLNDDLCSSLLERLKKIGKFEVNCENIVKSIFIIFVKDLESFILDYEFKRLRNEIVVDYYEKFLENSRTKSFQQNLFSTIKFFEKRKTEENSIIYIGKNSYADSTGFGGSTKVYVSLKDKNFKDLVNLAIIKLQIENDFISYKLNLFFDFLFEYEKISEEEYNKMIFGTNDQEKLKLLKLGLDLNIVNKLANDNQLDNIVFDKNHNIELNEDFKKYINENDDFIKFEFNKYFKF